MSLVLGIRHGSVKLPTLDRRPGRERALVGRPGLRPAMTPVEAMTGPVLESTARLQGLERAEGERLRRALGAHRPRRVSGLDPCLEP